MSMEHVISNTRLKCNPPSLKSDTSTLFVFFLRQQLINPPLLRPRMLAASCLLQWELGWLKAKAKIRDCISLLLSPHPFLSNIAISACNTGNLSGCLYIKYTRNLPWEQAPLTRFWTQCCLLSAKCNYKGNWLLYISVTLSWLVLLSLLERRSASPLPPNMFSLWSQSPGHHSEVWLGTLEAQMPASRSEKFASERC